MFNPMNNTQTRAVATGGVYRDIYPRPPKKKKKNQSTLNFLCGCFVSLQWLVNIYTHPNPQFKITRTRST